jgi:hypothetical protein
MMTDMKETNKDILNQIFKVELNEVDIVGEIKNIEDKGFTVNMIRPYKGLKTFIPTLESESSPDEIEKHVKAALLLLYKKADFYTSHRKEIQGKYADYIKKLNPKTVKATKEKWFSEFVKKREKLKKQLKKNKINFDALEKKLKEYRHDMLKNFHKLDDAKRKIESELFDGVIKLKDVEKLNTFFSDNFS